MNSEPLNPEGDFCRAVVYHLHTVIAPSVIEPVEM